jgi:hypothetical protein
MGFPVTLFREILLQVFFAYLQLAEQILLSIKYYLFEREHSGD